MITLRWAPYPESDVASYKVYRSIIGFRALLVSGANRSGKTLALKVNGGAVQTFTFNDTDEIIDTINDTVEGGEAYASIDDPLKFIFRSNIREAPGSVEIVGGTILVAMGLTAHLITEKSEGEVLATIAALEDPTEYVSYEDTDGSLQDYYAVSTVNSLGQESDKTAYQQAIYFTGPVCVMEGIVTDVQGVRQVDEVVKAKIVLIPQESPVRSSITKAWVETLTGPDGRFSLPLLQGAIVKFEVPSLGFSRNIRVPEKAYEFVTDLLIDLEYRYPLD